MRWLSPRSRTLLINPQPKALLYSTCAMDEIRASTPPPPPVAGEGTFSGQKQEASAMDRVKKGCVSFYASSQETLRYIKAFVVGWGKKRTAKNEKEAAEADLKTAKIEVEATEAAENTKQQLQKSL